LAFALGKYRYDRYATNSAPKAKLICPKGVNADDIEAIVSGEFIKIAVTIAMFVWVAFSYPDLQWIPLLVTYFVTLKCYWLAWFWR
jgi:F0F1-type ATP synthase assembly protein I